MSTSHVLHVLRPAVLLAGLLPLAAHQAQAHGLIQDPPSRNWFCGAITKPDQTGNGTAQYPECETAFATNRTGSYNFMSVLTHDLGRAGVTPLPENVCGFNSETFGKGATPWDTPMNWPTNPVSPGRKKISWNISWGPHFSDTAEFRYWITKPGFQFSPTKALSWADFEEQPFCTLKYDDTQPGANPDVVADKGATAFHTYCTLPQRGGRHVVYGEWGRNYFTYERFHSCMDVVYDGSGGMPPVASIALQPNVTEVTGPATLTLDGSNSQGTSLSYQWSLNPANAPSARLENPSAPIARLVLTEPLATQTLQVDLLVKNAFGQNNTASKTLKHKPSGASVYTDLGTLNGTARALKAGDAVSVRTVSTTGQDTLVPTPALVLDAANAAADAWPLALAQAVNAAGGGLRVGVLGSNGVVTPVASATANRMYALSSASLASAFLQVVSANAVVASYTVTSDWASGYCASVTVTNRSSTAAQPWSTTLKIVGRSNNVWNLVATQSGDTLALSGPAWASALQPGASFTAGGFCANK